MPALLKANKGALWELERNEFGLSSNDVIEPLLHIVFKLYIVPAAAYTFLQLVQRAYVSYNRILLSFSWGGGPRAAVAIKK